MSVEHKSVWIFILNLWYIPNLLASPLSYCNDDRKIVNLRSQWPNSSSNFWSVAALCATTTRWRTTDLKEEQNHPANVWSVTAELVQSSGAYIYIPHEILEEIWPPSFDRPIWANILGKCPTRTCNTYTHSRSHGSKWKTHKPSANSKQNAYVHSA